jgi:hypothetical protein
MDVVLGLLGIVAWIALVVGLAAAVTYAVVRVSPGDKPAASGPAPKS